MRPWLWLLLCSLCQPVLAAKTRVVSLSPNLTELAMSAGLPLVGRDSSSDFPPSVKALPAVGDAFALNLEALLQLKPDWVLVWDFGTQNAQVARLQALGMPVWSVQAKVLDDIPRTLETLAQQAPQPALGQAAAKRFRQQLQALSGRYAPRVGRKKPKVALVISENPLMVLTNDTLQGQALALCGAENAFPKAATPAPSISLEALIAAQPSVLVSTEALALPLLKLPVVRVDADRFYRPTVRFLDEIAQLCARL
jgi:iron complex transport system substrate-binding protein